MLGQSSSHITWVKWLLQVVVNFKKRLNMLYYLLTIEHEELCTSIEDAIQTGLGEACKCECLNTNADSIWYPADKTHPRIPKNFSCSADVLGFTTDGRWCKVYYGVDKQYHSSDDHNPITISHWMTIYTPETDD